MKLLKRVSALMLVFLMLLSLLPVSAFAASEQVVVQAGSVTGKPGDTVDVTIKLTENPGIIALRLFVDFDDTVLEIVDKGINEDEEYLNPEYNNPFNKGSIVKGQTYAQKPIPYLWDGSTESSASKKTGDLMTITFKIKENAKIGSSSIGVSVEDALDFNNERVEFATVNGSVTVADHTWGTPKYEWSNDYATCTASVACSCCADNAKSETVNSTKVDTPATCTAAQKTVYTAEFTYTLFAKQTKEVTGEAAKNHDWGTSTKYTWTADHSECTAEHTCQRTDCGLNETEKVTANVTTNASSCYAAGTKIYTATFTKAGFETQTFEETLGVVSHTWGTPTYKWSDDYAKCTAERSCTVNGCTGKETETVTAAIQTTSATCEDAGKTVYTADFANAAFETQTYTKPITKLGHNWGEITYTWAAGNSSCTAERTCASGCTETETKDSTCVTVAPENNKPGSKTYTVDFENPDFMTQQKVETQTLDPAIYMSSATACVGETVDVTVELMNNPGIAALELLVDYDDAVLELTGVADAELMGGYTGSETVASNPYYLSWLENNGTKVYGKLATLTFKVKENAAIGTTSVSVSVNSALNADMDDVVFNTTDGAVTVKEHEWGTVTYNWNADHTECTAKHACACGAEEVETVTASKVTTAAKCEEDGQTVYTATFENAAFKTQTHTETLNKLGHDWGTATYQWTDFSKCTASHKCERTGCGVTETEDGVITVTTVNPSCEATGKKTYTATFQKDGFTTQTKEETLAVLSHDMAPATCTEPATCKRDGCNHTEGEALGHEEETVAGKAATCTEAGLTDGKKCTVCKEITVKQTEIKKLDHKLGEFKVTKEPTYTEKGVETAKCENCDHTETREIPVKEAPETKVEISEGGIKEVPKELKEAGLETPAEVKEAITKAVITQNSKIDEDNIAHYDVTLMYTEDDGKTWSKADETHFPASGKLTVTLPYPDGTDKTYTFTVVHMFTSSAFGKTPGAVEMPKVTNTDNGISFEVTGLSPISVGWTAPEAPKYDCAVSGHVWDAGKVTTEATCTKEGVKTYTCTVEGCTETKTEAIKALGHTVDEKVWKSDATNHWHECKVCNEKVDTAKHSGGTATTTAKAKCETCGAEYGSLKSPTPQTGDNSNIALFGGLMMLSIVAIAALLLIDRKRNLVGKYSK